MFSLILIVSIALLVVIVVIGLAVVYFARTKAIKNKPEPTQGQVDETSSSGNPLNR